MASVHAMSLGYRPDVDGLRGVSVLLVLLFHFGVPFAPGGFVGVDVFFVISGFLITGIILQALKSGEFSFSWFYRRRILRILPALIAVVVTTLVLGYIFLFPDDYAKLAQSAISALLGVSNVHFLLNTGYFDAPSQLMPLLHTWSLGVEEQFYLFWPVILLGLFKWRRDSSTLLLATAAIIVLSFLLNLIEARASPKAAFYLPHTRAWELAIGALVAQVHRFAARIPKAVIEVFALAGFGLIMFAALTLRANNRYPGFDALLPAIGAAAIIWPGSQRTLVGRALSAPPIVFLGLISYSVYLWHWPINVFFRQYANGAVPSSQEAAVLVACSIAAGWLSWRWVERPFRQQPALLAGSVFKGAAVATTIVGLAGASVLIASGFPGRMSTGPQNVLNKDAMWFWKCPQDLDLGLPPSGEWPPVHNSCVIGADWRDAKTRAVLWGDSNAQHLLPLLNLVGKKTGASFALVNPCPAFIGRGISLHQQFDPNFNENCGKQQGNVIAYLSRHHEVNAVVLAAYWLSLPYNLYRREGDPRSTQYGLSLIEAGLEDLVRRLEDGSRRIIIFNTIPVARVDPLACAIAGLSLPRRSCAEGLGRKLKTDLALLQVPIQHILEQVARRHHSVFVVNPADPLCPGDQCSLYVNGEFLYRDAAHFRRNLSPTALEELANLLNLEAVFQTAPQTSANAPKGQ